MRVALVPAYNEGKTIFGVITKARSHVDRVVVCDDGSKDETYIMASAMAGTTVIRHERNQGKGEALRSLFQFAIDSNFDQVVTLDADSQHDADEIPKLLEALKDSDMVIGSRIGLSPVRGMGNRILSGSEIDAQSGFRAYRGSILPLLIPSEQGYGADAEILRLAKEKGLRIVQVPVSNMDSVPTPHKANIVLHFFDALFTDFKLASFRHPMLTYAVPGFLLVVLGFWFAVKDFTYLVSQGFGSVILLTVGLFALQTGILLWVLISIQRKGQN